MSFFGFPRVDNNVVHGISVKKWIPPAGLMIKLNVDARVRG